MFFLQRAPGPPLSAFVDSIWLCRNDPRPHVLERVFPNGSAQLIVNLKEDQTRLYDPVLPDRCATTAGAILLASIPAIRSSIPRSRNTSRVSRSRPEGSCRSCDVPAHETCDVDIPAEDLWGRPSIADFRGRVLEGASPAAARRARGGAPRHVDAARPSPAVAFALAVFDARRRRRASDVRAPSLSAPSGSSSGSKGSRPDAEALLPDSALPARSSPRASRVGRSTGPRSRWTAATSTRRTSSTSSAGSPACPRPPSGVPDASSRTTSNFLQSDETDVGEDGA